MQPERGGNAPPETDTTPAARPVESGAYALMVETADHGPILLETDGGFSDYDTAVRRGALFEGAVRWAVVELKPVYGNKLLFMDFERMQNKGA